MHRFDGVTDDELVECLVHLSKAARSIGRSMRIDVVLDELVARGVLGVAK